MRWHEENRSESADNRNRYSNSQGGPANARQLAGALASRFGARSVIDVGCVSSRNFLTAPGFRKLGITVDSSLRERCERYPSISWVGIGSNELAQTAGFYDEIKQSVVICSDLAERVVEGSSIFDGLARLRALAHAMIITTPETHGGELTSGPDTPARGSAWTLSMFRDFLTGKGMTPTFLGFTASNTADNQGKTIVAICDGCPPAEWRSPDPGFHPLAIVTTYNDTDIAIQTVLKLLDDGIDVDVLDNWSTDGTFEQLMVLSGLRQGLRNRTISGFRSDRQTRVGSDFAAQGGDRRQIPRALDHSPGQRRDPLFALGRRLASGRPADCRPDEVHRGGLHCLRFSTNRLPILSGQ